MPNRSLPLLLAGTLALALGAQAAPKNENAQGQGQGHKPKAAQQQGGKQNQQNQYHDDRQGGYQDRDDDRYDKRERDYRHDWDEDLSDIERILRGYRSPYPVQALPPGIAKNLARGKPLPPGIAKKLDPSLARQLPYYPGYEWRQMGTDAVLVEVGTSVVREVLRDILR